MYIVNIAYTLMKSERVKSVTNAGIINPSPLTPNNRAMKKQGHQLKFISKIDSNGKGITILEDYKKKSFQDTEFTLVSLSITEGTYIASAFSSFVVKIIK